MQLKGLWDKGVKESENSHRTAPEIKTEIPHSLKCGHAKWKPTKIQSFFGGEMKRKYRTVKAGDDNTLFQCPVISQMRMRYRDNGYIRDGDKEKDGG